MREVISLHIGQAGREEGGGHGRAPQKNVCPPRHPRPPPLPPFLLTRCRIDNLSRSAAGRTGVGSQRKVAAGGGDAPIFPFLTRPPPFPLAFPPPPGIQVGNACWELYCLEHG